MTNTPISNPDQNSDPNQIASGKDDAESTQPGKRLRRLLQAVEDEAARLEAESEAPSVPDGIQEPLSEERRESHITDTSEEDIREQGTDLTWGWINDALPTAENGETNFDVDQLQEDEDMVDEMVPAAPAIEVTPPSGTPRERGVISDKAKDAHEGALPPPPGFNDQYLPRRVDEVDMEATQITPLAFGQPPLFENREPLQQVSIPKPQGFPQATTSVRQPAPPPFRPSGGYPNNPAVAISASPSQPKKRKKLQGCLIRGFIGVLFLGIVLVVAVGAYIVFQYFNIMRELEAEGKLVDLRERTSKFETARILDRNGNTLYEIIDPTGGRRTYVPLKDISPYLLAATLATEDKEFYNHPGFDILAIARAMWSNYTTGETVSGASTITQQLARLLLLTDERYEITIDRKAREIVLAAELTRRYSKNEILEIYLNEISYGNFAYGIEAAAETYFNTTASQLTLGQAAFLAGLPQAPSVYDIYNNRDATIARFEDVVTLMFELSQEKNCIRVLISEDEDQLVCVDAPVAATAMQEIENYAFKENPIEARYPHWVTYIRTLVEDEYGPQAMYRNGFTIYTTLDPGLQDAAQEIVWKQVDALADRKVTNGALVAIRPNTGEILALVGSADFYNEAISGQVNMALAPRQPGSSIKPLTYVAAFEKGWTPATLIWDIPSSFTPSGQENDPGPVYVPVNYDGKYHGPVTVRSALANSYNVPAVKALKFIGIYDNPNTVEPDGFIKFAERLGITTLTRPDYGLSLTLGGGDVSLLEMVGAYSIFANGGKRIPTVAITKIVDFQGNLVYQYTPPQNEQVIRAEHAYLISSILSDNEARKPMFGPNSVLNLPFQVAAKTGTTNDFRDNWTIGYTPDVVVGVWVGNADYTPMENTSGLTGAAPIWAEFMQIAVQSLTGGNPNPFSRPAGVVDRVICTLSGTEPSEWCPNQRGEVFAYDQLPLPKEKDFWSRVLLDSWTGYRASAECGNFTLEKAVLNITESEVIDWINNTQQGQEWATSLGFSQPVFYVPQRDCRSSDSRPTIFFAGLSEGQTIDFSPLDIYVLVDATSDFKYFRLEYGEGSDPKKWNILVDEQSTLIRQPERVYTWDLTAITANEVTLRLYVRSTRETYAEKRIRLVLRVPTVTPTPTITQTMTLTMTPTPTQTATFTQTQTPTWTLTPTTTRTSTLTFTPTETPSATPTPTPTETQTPTDTPVFTDTPTPTDTLSSPP